MSKMTLFFLFASVVVIAVAIAASEDDWDELGIGTKHGKTSAAGAVEKATELDKKYEKAKSNIVRAVGGERLPLGDPVHGPKAVPGNTTLKMKNGQTLYGARITGSTPDGYWFEIEGASTFIAKSEIEKIETT